MCDCNILLGMCSKTQGKVVLPSLSWHNTSSLGCRLRTLCCADDFENAKYYKMFSNIFFITAKKTSLLRMCCAQYLALAEML